jgi:hypothetical protein
MLNFKCDDGTKMKGMGTSKGSTKTINTCDSGYSKIKISHGSIGVGSYTPYCNGIAQDKVGTSTDYYLKKYTDFVTCPNDMLISGVSVYLGSADDTFSLKFYCRGD